MDPVLKYIILFPSRPPPGPSWQYYWNTCGSAV